MKKITRSQIKWIKQLQSKTNRKQAEYFVIEGNKLISEALEQHHINIHSIYATTLWLENVQKKSPTIATYSCTHAELQQLSTQTNVQDVLAIVHKEYDIAATSVDSRWILVLENVQDPGNVGTIIRTCDWYGVRKIICSAGCAHKFNPKTIQASMGAVFRIEITYEEDIYRWVMKQEKKVWVSSLEEDSIAHTEVATERQGILVLGNESQGVSTQLSELSTHKIRIAQSKKSKADSLNVAIACGILLDRLVSKN